MSNGAGDQQHTVALNEQERALLDSVDSYLARGVQLKRWWEQTREYAERFELGLTFNRPDTSFGFFDQTVVDGRPMAVMGNVQDMFYDQPKAPGEGRDSAAQWMQEQIREFVLHYFMRVSDFRQPQGAVVNGHAAPPPVLRPLSWCQQPDPQRIGFGFSQLFYKLRNNGQIGRFPEQERFAIVDLRDIGQKYEWIVVKVRIFDFSFTYAPFGGNAPQVVLPLSEASYLVLSGELIADEDQPAPGMLGRYGLGYAFIKDPTPGLLAYGPGEFDAAVELINFQVFEDGRTRVHMVFVANRPERIVNVSLNPVDWGFRLADALSFGFTSRVLAPLQEVLDRLPFWESDVDPVYAFITLANGLTGGQAAQTLCISQQELDRQFLLKHFTQHYQTIAGSLQTWRQIPNWLAGEATLLANPRTRWVVTGSST